MSESKHTPGPWHVSRAAASIADADGTPIANLPAMIATLAHRAANAHLIAAAPELLTACEQMRGLLEYVEATADPRPAHMAAVRENATAAIAKARGRS